MVLYSLEAVAPHPQKGAVKFCIYIYNIYYIYIYIYISYLLYIYIYLPRQVFSILASTEIYETLLNKMLNKIDSGS